MDNITPRNYMKHYNRAVSIIGKENLPAVEEKILNSIRFFKREYSQLSSGYATSKRFNNAIKELSNEEKYELLLNMAMILAKDGRIINEKDRRFINSAHLVYTTARDQEININDFVDIDYTIRKCKKIILSDKLLAATTLTEKTKLSKELTRLKEKTVSNVEDIINDTEESAVKLAVTMYGIAKEKSDVNITEKECGNMAAAMMYLSKSMKNDLEYARTCRKVFAVLVRWTPIAVLTAMTVLFYFIFPLWLFLWGPFSFLLMCFLEFFQELKNEESETETEIIDSLLMLYLYIKDAADDVIGNTLKTLIKTILYPIALFCRFYLENYTAETPLCQFCITFLHLYNMLSLSKDDEDEDPDNEDPDNEDPETDLFLRENRFIPE